MGTVSVLESPLTVIYKITGELWAAAQQIFPKVRLDPVRSDIYFINQKEEGWRSWLGWERCLINILAGGNDGMMMERKVTIQLFEPSLLPVVQRVADKYKGQLDEIIISKQYAEPPAQPQSWPASA